MGLVSKLTIGVVLLSLYASFIHRPIPADVPDKAYFQILVDYLSAVELAASITEWLGFSYRWWSYPGNLDIISVASPFSDIEIVHTQFDGVNSALLSKKDFKERSEPGPAMVFLHGGGWVFGSYRTYKGVYIQAAEETSFLVMAPEYRKAPHHSFPVPFEDCLNSTIEFMKRAEEFNVDPTKIVIIGDSAGGNLAMAVTMEIIRLREKDDSIPMPAMVTLIYPTLQMANYQLPSYQQNQPFMFYPSLIPKFFLSYIGLIDRMDLAEILYINGHVREEVKEKVKGVSSDTVPEKFKERGYNASTTPLTLQQKAILDESVLNLIEKSFLDPRVAPLMTSDTDLASMPRTHIVVCEYDTLRDDGILLYERLKKLKRHVTLQHLDGLHATLNIGSVFQSSYYGEQNKLMYKTIQDNFS